MLLKYFKWKQVASWTEIGNANLILIWPHSHIQQKNWRCRFAKNTVVEVLKMHYLHTVIKFVCRLSTVSWSPEKYVTSIPPSNLFVVGVPVEKKKFLSLKIFSDIMIFFNAIHKK